MVHARLILQANERNARMIRTLGGAVCLLTLLTVQVVSADEPAKADCEVFRTEVAPLLQRFCTKCHSSEKPKGGLNLAAYNELDEVLKARKVWERVLENLETEIMPPDKAEKPSDEERARAVAWIQGMLSKVECDIENPGRVTMRRLNRAEYNNTIRDLLAVDIQPADEFPFDNVGYGFDTIGDVQSLPPMLMEKYLAAAQRIAERAVIVPRVFDGTIGTWEARQMTGEAADATPGRRLASNGGLTFTVKPAEKGRFRLRIIAYGEQAGPEPAQMAVRLDKQVLKKFEVKAVADTPGTYECELAVKQPGERQVSLDFINDYYNEQASDANQRDRNLVIVSATLLGTASPPLWPLERWDWKQLEGGQLDEPGKNRSLPSNGEVFKEFNTPAEGIYRFETHAYGSEAGREPAKMAWVVDGRQVRIDEVPNKWDQPGLFSIIVPLSAGKHKIAVAFTNDYYQPDHADPALRGDRNLNIQDLAVWSASPKALPDSHARVIKRTPRRAEEWAACTKENLESLLLRAYRRPARPREVEQLSQLVELARKSGEGYEEAMRWALQAVLINPNFLYRVELERAPKQGDTTQPAAVRPLNDFELASRLSYFLWSSMPDEELLKLAAEHRLQNDDILEQQTRRMLADRRSRALVDNFAGQWLQIRNVANVSPDARRFKDFDRALLGDMKRETEECFAFLVQQDRDVRELLAADYTFLNERLAKFYGIEGVSGPEFRKVALPPDSQRGGLITQASILTITSNPTRTSPVKRGKWILEQILGSPPPPPPPDIPELKDDRRARSGASLRQRLEQHRANPSCAACHAKMDPLGFGLENFNAVGAWREKDGEFPIDASGLLPGGKQFVGPKELKTYLRDEKAKQFTRTLVEKLVTFGLGRGLQAYDACSVDDIAGRVADDNHRFSRIVIEIIKSAPFRKTAREEVPAS
jgi:hypothetical protein